MKTFSKMAVAAIALMGASIGASGSAMAVAPAWEQPGPSGFNLGVVSATSQGVGTVNFGSLDPAPITPPSFTDTWTFSLANPSQVSGTATGVNSGSAYGAFAQIFGQAGTTINSVTIADINGNSLYTVNSSGSNSLSVNASNILSAVPATYEVIVTGAVSAFGGGYNLTVSDVAAVPIPGAVVLFGSGLIGLAGMARRRAQTAKA